jgi:hypothetical protein
MLASGGYAGFLSVTPVVDPAMRASFALVLLSSILSGAAFACPASDPVAMARDMYTSQYYFYADGKPSEHLSPALLKLLQRDWKCQEPGEQCAIGADP